MNSLDRTLLRMSRDNRFSLSLKSRTSRNRQERLVAKLLLMSDGDSGNGNADQALRPERADGAASLVRTQRAQSELIEADGGPGSGNFGHAGRKGQRGGSSKSGTGGHVSGNLGRTASGEALNSKDYSLSSRGLQSAHRDGVWKAEGKKTDVFPEGSGSTVINEADTCVGLHSVNKFLDENHQMSAERAELHEAIVNDLFKDKKPVPDGEEKTFYFLGGGPASGKGSFTDPEKSELYSVLGKDKCAVIDSDELKKSLPEYDIKTGMLDREKAASFVHEESSALAKRAMQAAFKNGYNCTLDGTGDGSVGSVLKKIKQARAAGYKVEARYCTAQIETAIARNMTRAKKTGRKVQLDSVVNIHKAVSSIFPKVASEFDHVTLWDHNGSSPVLVAECYRGQEISVKNKEMYDRFLAKADWNS